MLSMDCICVVRILYNVMYTIVTSESASSCVGVARFSDCVSKCFNMKAKVPTCMVEKLFTVTSTV